jgi:hypothetical protein
VHSLESEISALERAGAIDAAAATRAAGLESGRVFTVHRELEVALYAAVAAVAGGVGLLVKDNLDRIGPLTLIVALLFAAMVCYLAALRAQWGGKPRRIADDYVLVLGALLLSSAVGYAELQFRLLGSNWSRHLLILAAWHAYTAYALDSRLLLSIALTSFAGWLGVETQLGDLWGPHHRLFGMAYRLLACAAVFVGAREVHRQTRNPRRFVDVYDHFAAHFAFWGALALLMQHSTRWLGTLVLVPIALYVGVRGFRQGRETFVLYAVGYSAFGACVLEAELLRDALLTALLGLITISAAVWLLWRLRARMKDAAS